MSVDRGAGRIDEKTDWGNRWHNFVQQLKSGPPIHRGRANSGKPS